MPLSAVLSELNVQAKCRAELHQVDPGTDSGCIPTTQENADSPLRHVFRAADKKQRIERAHEHHKELLGNDLHPISIKAN